MSFKSSYTTSEGSYFVDITCRDALLDRRFFDKLADGNTHIHVTVDCEDVEHVTLDLTGVEFSRDPFLEHAVPSLVIDSGDTESITLVSGAGTGVEHLTLEGNKCYDLSQFNGEGIETLHVGAIEEGLVIEHQNFPSLQEVFIYDDTTRTSRGKPVHLHEICLRKIRVDGGEVVLSDCTTES